MRRFAIVHTMIFLITMSAGVAQGASPRECIRKTSDRVPDCIETLKRMRSLQTAIEAYGYDHKAYPAAQSMTELREKVQPTYIRTTPTADAWGTDFRYLPSADGKSYRLVSPGSDKTFDESTWAVEGLLESSTEDAVFSSKGVTREWTIQK